MGTLREAEAFRLEVEAGGPKAVERGPMTEDLADTVKRIVELINAIHQDVCFIAIGDDESRLHRQCALVRLTKIKRLLPALEG